MLVTVLPIPTQEIVVLPANAEAEIVSNPVIENSWGEPAPVQLDARKEPVPLMDTAHLIQSVVAGDEKNT
jgi:hypothetical protein